MTLLADAPRVDYFGASRSGITAAFIVMDSPITYHDFFPITYHNGTAITFHDPVYPDLQLVKGSGASSYPRIDFAGEAD